MLAKSINILGEFLGRRDVTELTPSAMQDRFGFSQADAMVLFGGSILKGGDILAHTPIPKEVQQAYQTLLASGLAPR